MGIFDIVEIGDAYVFPGKGEPTIKVCALPVIGMLSKVQVQFRIVVFRPFVGEVIVGTVCSLNEEG